MSTMERRNERTHRYLIMTTGTTHRLERTIVRPAEYIREAEPAVVAKLPRLADHALLNSVSGAHQKGG